MKHSKPFYAIIAVLFLALLYTATYAKAASPEGGTCGENLAWEFSGYKAEDSDTGLLVVSGIGPMEDYDPDADVHAPWSMLPVVSAEVRDGVTRIGEFAFDRLPMLKSVSIPDSVEFIGRLAFNFTELTDVSVPCSVGDMVFMGCQCLQNVVFQEGVTTVGDYVFWDNTALETVFFPATLEALGSGCFLDTPALREITVDPACEAYCSANGVLFSAGFEELIRYPSGKADTSYTIPDSVCLIDSYAFEGASALEEITIPYRVSHIYGEAFAGCNSLRDVYFTGEESEWNAINREEKGIGPLLALQIHFKPADWSWKLEDGILIISGERIPRFINGEAPWYESREQIKGIVVEDGVKGIASGAFFGCDSAVYAKLPDSVEWVEPLLFKDCTSLQSVVLPDGLEDCWSAFYGCSSLKEVTLPSESRVLNYFVFSGCTSLEEIIVPDSVTVIQGFAFRDCVGLKSVTLPAGLVRIQSMAFTGCDALTDVWFGGTQEDWNRIEIRNGNEPLTAAVIHFAGE